MAIKPVEIKVRVQEIIKEKINNIAASRFTSESEIVREALLQYLRRHEPSDLKEDTTPYQVNSSKAYTSGKEGQDVHEVMQDIMTKGHIVKPAPASQSSPKPNAPKSSSPQEKASGKGRPKTQ